MELLANRCHNCGLACYTAGNHEEARRWLEDAVSCLEQAGTGCKDKQARFLRLLAACYSCFEGHLEKALSCAELASERFPHPGILIASILS